MYVRMYIQICMSIQMHLHDTVQVHVGTYAKLFHPSLMNLTPVIIAWAQFISDLCICILQYLSLMYVVCSSSFISLAVQCSSLSGPIPLWHVSLVSMYAHAYIHVHRVDWVMPQAWQQGGFTLQRLTSHCLCRAEDGIVCMHTKPALSTMYTDISAAEIRPLCSENSLRVCTYMCVY